MTATKRTDVLNRALALAIAHHEETLEGENGYAFKHYARVDSYGVTYTKSSMQRELEEFRNELTCIGSKGGKRK